MADWNWADLSGVGSMGAFILTLGGLLHLHGRQTKSTDEIAATAREAKDRADQVADDLAEYKTTAAKEFVPRVHLDQMENRIIQRIDQQDTRNDTALTEIRQRLDKIIDWRPKA